MFSPVARDVLKPVVFERMENLMKPVLPVIDDPWIDDYYKFNTFTHKLRDLTAGKRNRAFQLYLNANQYQPQDINIKIADDLIVVHGKHGIKPDTHGYVTREFIRRCKIPDYVDPTALDAVFNKNGLLIIKTRKETEESSSNGEAFIPIEVQKSVVNNVVVEGEEPEIVDESVSNEVVKEEETETVDESVSNVVEPEAVDESVSNVVIKKEML